MCFSLHFDLVLKSMISRKGWLVPISVFAVFFLYYFSYNLFCGFNNKGIPLYNFVTRILYNSL